MGTVYGLKCIQIFFMLIKLSNSTVNISEELIEKVEAVS